jgi:carbonic anhydrase/acetyltransferase-like protein (isoleucine patch superfamily)
VLQTFQGNTPRLHSTAWAHDGAWLIGDVELGPDVSVWPTAVLRGDMGRIRIGAQSNVQDGAVLHMTTNMSHAIVGERVTVGHKAILHGCIVEDDCLIGMGSILLDNCRIGAGSIVAAGALVPVGRVIPPNSLVMGSPGKVVSELSDSHRRMIAFSWKSYVEKCRVWREG